MQEELITHLDTDVFKTMQDNTREPMSFIV